MEVEYTTAWKAVSIVQFVWFFGTLLACGFTFFKIRPRVSRMSSVRSFFIFFVLFAVCKVVGGIVALVFLEDSSFDVSLYAVAYCFDSIALGFTTRCLFMFISHFYKTEPTADKSCDIQPTLKLSKWHPFRLLTFLLLAAIILSAVGASEKANGIKAPAISETGAILFLVTIIILMGLFLRLYRSNEQSCAIFWYMFAILVLLVVRCAYAVLIAFRTSDTTAITKYSLFFGEWKYYAFMALLIEGIVSVMLLVLINIFPKWYDI